MIEVVPPAGSDFRLTSPPKSIARCTSAKPCRKSAAGNQFLTVPGMARVAGTSANDLDQDRRGGKSFRFEFRTYCLLKGRRQPDRTSSMTIVYKPSGLGIDLKRSDLNGNGRPDGRA